MASPQINITLNAKGLEALQQYKALANEANAGMKKLQAEFKDLESKGQKISLQKQKLYNDLQTAKKFNLERAKDLMNEGKEAKEYLHEIKEGEHLLHKGMRLLESPLLRQGASADVGGLLKTASQSKAFISAISKILPSAAGLAGFLTPVGLAVMATKLVYEGAKHIAEDQKEQTRLTKRLQQQEKLGLLTTQDMQSFETIKSLGGFNRFFSAVGLIDSRQEIFEKQQKREEAGRALRELTPEDVLDVATEYKDLGFENNAADKKYLQDFAKEIKGNTDAEIESRGIFTLNSKQTTMIAQRAIQESQEKRSGFVNWFMGNTWAEQNLLDEIKKKAEEKLKKEEDMRTARELNMAPIQKFKEEEEERIYNIQRQTYQKRVAAHTED